MQLTKFQKLRILYTKEKHHSVTDMSGHSFTQKKLQLNQLKHNQLPPQNHSATLTSENQIEPLHHFVKPEPVLLSQKDGCHLVLADFRIDQVSIRNNEKGEIIMTKPLDLLSF